MKRFIASLLAVAVFAQDETAENGDSSDCQTEECENAESGWGDFTDWVKSE
jgi:hypothetical protein